jgi:hypothetical protein
MLDEQDQGSQRKPCHRTKLQVFGVLLDGKLCMREYTLAYRKLPDSVTKFSRVYTMAAGVVGCRVDSARRTNRKRSTAQVLRGGSKNILPQFNRASGLVQTILAVGVNIEIILCGLDRIR